MTEQVEQKVDVVEPTEIEIEAIAQGWVTKEQWIESGRSPEDHRPAKEFVDRGDLYKTIHSTKRDLKQTQAALTALQRHHQFVFEKAHQQAVDDLKREKRTAIRNEEFERAEEIDTEIEETKAAHEQEKQQVAVAQAQVAQTGPHPDFVEWTGRNQWYMIDNDLQEFADATGLVYANKHPGVDPRTVLKYVEDSVKRKFPEKFGTKKAAPNAVASVDRTNTKVTKSDDMELTATEQEIMTTLVRQGVLTEAEYKAELKKVGR